MENINIVLRGVTDPRVLFRRHVVANALFVLLLARELVVPVDLRG